MQKPMNRNDRLTQLSALGCVLGVLASACAVEHASAKVPTYAELKQDELTSERREFISDTQKRLARTTNDMDLLRIQLEHESPYVERAQRAEWSQELFELGHECDRLRGDLDRAQTASAAEWEQMRGPLGVATDSLQARVSQVGLQLAGDPQGAPREPAVTISHMGLCSVHVAAVEADVTREARTMVVTLTTDGAGPVLALQARAQNMTKVEAYPAAGERATDRSEPPFTNGDAQVRAVTPPRFANNGSARAAELIPVKITAQNVNDGVKLVFAPEDGQLDDLETRLESDSERLEQGLCAASQEVGLNNTSNK